LKPEWSIRHRVLHVGCGRQDPRRLHPAFRDRGQWDELRLDIDPRVQPDIVCSTVDMSQAVPSASVDVVWTSHTVEHLHDHDAARAFAEFRRVLRPNGFLLIRCPDVDAVLRCFLEKGPEHVAYESPAGPITPLDMLFGHRSSISAGNIYMSHNTAFNDERIATMLLEAGFAEVRTRAADGFDLWAVAFAPEADIPAVLTVLEKGGLIFEPAAR
jgi:predicted SAM-dependent methyltransferase